MANTHRYKLLIGLFIIFTVLIIIYFNFLRPTEITILYRNDRLKTFDHIVDDFEDQHPNIKINHVKLPINTDKKYKMIMEYLNSDRTVDIIDSDIVWVNDFINNGYVTPLDPYFTKNEIEAFLTSPINGNIVDATLYGIPYRTDAGILYYRKDLLKKYNLPTPKSWNDIIDYSKIIMAKEDIYGYGASWFQYEGLTCNIMEIFWSYGGNISPNMKDYATENNKQALELIRRLVNEKIVHPDIQNFKSSDLRDAFIKGDLIFMRDWPTGWKYVQDQENSTVVDKVEIKKLPLGNPTGENKGALGGWQLMVPEESTHKEAAVEFIKFFINKENNKKLIMEHSYLPTRLDLYNDSDVIAKIPFIKNKIELFNNSKPRPRFENYTEFSNIFQNLSTQYINNTIDQEIFFEKLNDQLENVK